MGSHSGSEKSRVSYDVIVVGAGPAGATAAYYLAGGMKEGTGRRVALLEKAAFPRDKYCGDAWCAPALDILEEMGVLQKLEAEGLVRDTTSGGFISPSGESYVSVEESEAVAGTRCYAIKRIICDERIARRAAEVGAELFENAAVAAAELEADGLWTVSCHDGRRFRSRMLVAADGATSRIARSLGVVTTPPEGVAGRQYVKGGTHNFKSGGVLFYPKYVLPGYVALFRHYDDDIDLGCYAIPGGAVSPDRLVDLYENQIRNDPFIQRALGPRVEFRERLRVASLRLGGVERSTARQFMAVGDAAGQTDPLTGEGIHTGMIGGKLAAQTIHELFARGEFSAEACRLYHERWMAAFGRDFRASAAGARLIYRFPLLLDVANLTAQRKGDAFMAEFGAAMTGVKPKTVFLRPDVALPMGAEVVRQVLRQKLLRNRPAEEVAYAARAVEETQRATAFRNSCLIDAGVAPAPPPPDAGAEEAESRALEEIFRHAGHDPAARRVLVLYGSEYGFAREMAHRLCEALARLKVAGEGSALSPRCVSMADHEIVDWDETTTCLLVCSTAGDGVPPTDARGFFKRLASPTLDLSGLRCGTLALGDRTYPHFCRAGRRLDERLRERGAEPLVSRVDVDREDMAAVDGWIDAVCTRLSEPATWEGARADPRREGLAERARQHFARLSEQPRAADAGGALPGADPRQAPACRAGRGLRSGDDPPRAGRERGGGPERREDRLGAGRRARRDPHQLPRRGGGGARGARPKRRRAGGAARGRRAGLPARGAPPAPRHQEPDGTAAGCVAGSRRSAGGSRAGEGPARRSRSLLFGVSRGARAAGRAERLLRSGARARAREARGSARGDRAALLLDRLLGARLRPIA